MSDRDDHMASRNQRGWIIVLVICLGIVAWGLVNYWCIPDAARQWDYGALPDVPGEGPYSTGGPLPKAPAPPQVTPLPEARPLTKTGGP